MPDLTITVLDEDWPMLALLAKRDWRGEHLDLQASAMFAVVMRTERARAGAADRSRSPAARRSRSSSSNGSVRVEV